MATVAVDYSSITKDRNPFRNEDDQHENTIDVENEDTPIDIGVMIHVVPESNKARWNHIEDLDSFFTRMYSYHQKHGFYVIALDESFQLLQLTFVVWILTFVVYCVKYTILFGDEPPAKNRTKVTIPDVLIPLSTCATSFGIWTWFLLFMSALIFIFRFIKVLYHITQYWDIKQFFNTALKIEDNELDNITWHEVQKKIREVQSEQQMCIHKDQLTELDIYHRILRFKNYMVAMMNKNVLPSKVRFPFLGEVNCLSRGLIYNIELILFKGPFSPFKNKWELKEEYKRGNNKVELARKLRSQIMWLALANLVFSPFVFIWSLTYYSFTNVAILKKEPGALGARCWSSYGRLMLRHFNELEHELDARLNRAYESADKYMSSFSSPLIAVIAKNVLFICGGLLVVIISLGIYDEFTFQVEHVITIATALTAIGVVCRVLLPEENLIWCPEQLLTAVLAHVHYLPPHWRGKAHISRVRKEFGSFFQFKAEYLIGELISPIITPFILLYVLRPRALDIVNFLHHFTVSVVGVGDVCAFAQMDVKKHGNPEWQIPDFTKPEETSELKINQYNQGENGKTELSLIHFKLTNPEWIMPPIAESFLQDIRAHVRNDIFIAKSLRHDLSNETAMEQSLRSFGSIRDEYSSIARSVILSSKINLPDHYGTQQRRDILSAQNFGPTCDQLTSYNHANDFKYMLQQNLGDASLSMAPGGYLQNIKEDEIDENITNENNLGRNMPDNQKTREMFKSVKVGVSKREGRLEGPKEGVFTSLYSLNHIIQTDPTEITTVDMCLSTLFMHELHHRRIQQNNAGNKQQQRHNWIASQSTRFPFGGDRSINLTKNAEKTPLLGQQKL